MRARRLGLVFLLLGFFAGHLCAGAVDAPLADWIYADLSTLQEAGLLPQFQAGSLAPSTRLSRYECALYTRTALLNYSENSRAAGGSLSSPAEQALARLVEEFAPELRALGVAVAPWPGETANRSVYIDLDNLLETLAGRPEAPPIKDPPPPRGTGGPAEMDLPDQNTLLLPIGEDNINTYRLLRPESFSIPLHDFRKYPNSLIGLAGEVLGLEWAVDLEIVSPQALLDLPLRLGGFMISGESQREKIRGGVGLRLGGELGVGFDALWFLDLDEAQFAMDRLILDLNTRVPLGERMGVFGGLSLEYHGGEPLTEDQSLGSQALAGLRVMLWEDLYLIAEYSLANPFSETLPHWQGPSVGLGLGEIGLILLGIKTPTYARLENLELTGLFIYRF